MKVFRKHNAPRYKRDGIESFLLVSKKTGNADQLAVTCVEMEPGGFQQVHSHHPEQMYYILEGSGKMTVDEETFTVSAGDCVYFRSNARHGLENSGSTQLRYLSAASPSFTLEECDSLWPLNSYEEGS